MREGDKGAGRERSRSLVLGIGLCVATAGLVWLGYRATEEWRRSSALLLERRTEVMLALLSTALNRDMKGAQVSVLLPIGPKDVAADPPHDLREAFARAFARFPYPESFFVWQDVGGGDGRTWFFNRSDRPPPWDHRQRQQNEPYPVVMWPDPPGAQALIAAARAQSLAGKRFAILDWEAAGTPYQVVLQFLPHASSAQPAAVAGFTVNLPWVRETYFPELLRQVARIGGGQESVSLAVLDDAGRTVASTGPIEPGAPVRDRRFALLFFDSAMTSLLSPGAKPPPRWTVRVGGANDRVLAAATRGADRTLGLLALAAAASVVGLLLTARAVRVRAELATMKSEFVSTVTHELKGPLALIRLVGDTLAMGRYTSTDAIRDYARLLSQEAQRLTRLIDNLLTYARVTDAERSYAFEALDLADVVEDALDRFRPLLRERGFEVGVDVPVDLPRIRADRTALLQAIDNLVDNAIKYSAARPSLAIRGRKTDGAAVRLEVSDQGHGIPKEELPRVFEKFYRGQKARSGGSGLGLAIVRRVVTDHGGQIGITSTPGEGTSVSLDLPLAEGTRNA